MSVGPIAASSLKLVKIDRWPQKSAILSKTGHFVAIEMDNVGQNFPLDKQTFICRYQQVMKTIDAQRAEAIRIEALTCVRDIYKYLVILRGSTRNEAEVRFAFANPIVTMLCSVHGLFVGMEYKMAPPVVGVGGVGTASTGSKSSADYVCYTLHHQFEDSCINLAAVIIEVKTDANHTSNAIAQLLGYYLRSCTRQDEHTVGLLLTETKVHVVFFPFVSGKGNVSCVNSIWLHSIEYSSNNTWNTIGMLSLLVVVTSRDFHFNIKLEDRLYPISKDYNFLIKNEIEMMRDELKKLKEVEEEKAKRLTELEEESAKKLKEVEEENAKKLKEIDEEKAKVELEKRAVKADKEKMAAVKKEMEAKCKDFEIALKKLTAEEVASISTSLKNIKL